VRDHSSSSPFEDLFGTLVGSIAVRSEREEVVPVTG
jgi:hypothetical protein